MSHLSEAPADTIWRFVKIVLKLLLVLGILGAIFLAWVAWRIRESFPPIHPVPAPVVWVTRDIALSAEEPVVRGRLVLTVASAPSQYLRVGVNAGAPAAAAMASPGALLTGPTVRIASDAGQGQDSCFAPCELQIQPSWDCDTSGCRMVAGLSVELSSNTDGFDGAVTIEIAGGASGSLDDELPNGLRATLELGDDIAPGAS